MALIDNSPITPNITGKIGGISFSNGIAGRTMKQAGRRTNKPTHESYRAKATISTLQKAWTNLSQADREQWNAFATFKPTLQNNQSGKTCSGQQLFIKYNCANQYCNDEVKAQPTFQAYDFPFIYFIVRNDGGTLYVDSNEAIDMSLFFPIIKLSAPISAARKNPPGGVKYIYTNFSGGTSVDITSRYTELYGFIPTTDQHIFLEYQLFGKDITDWTAKILSNQKVV